MAERKKRRETDGRLEVLPLSPPPSPPPVASPPPPPLLPLAANVLYSRRGKEEAPSPPYVVVQNARIS